MSSTSFVDYNTVIQASWLNDVNTNTYQNSDLSYPVTAIYSANINITSVTQTVGYLGQAYAPIFSALPFTTSGTFETAKFMLIQGVSAGDLVAIIQPFVDTATNQANISTAQAGLATIAKTQAESARDAANAAGKVFSSTAAGIAATTSGQYFSIP